MTHIDHSESDSFKQQREAIHRQMLSAVSHDLKTPLASIIGSIEVYRRMGKNLDEAKRDALLHTALVEASRLDSFLTNILDLAKLENDLVPIRNEQTVVRQVLEDMVATLGARSGQADISIKGVDTVTIDTDQTLLARAIHLLVDNAVKHAGEAPKITIAYGLSDKNKLTVRVTDDGPGIPADRRREIFNKYTRLKRGDMQTAGTGLGLNIAQIIAERLGGDLVLVEGEGSGASFELTVKA